MQDTSPARRLQSATGRQEACAILRSVTRSAAPSAGKRRLLLRAPGGTSDSVRRGATGYGHRPGSTCPACRRGKLEYDGCLILRCPACGFAESGAPT